MPKNYQQIGEQNDWLMNNQVIDLLYHCERIYWLFRIHTNFFNCFLSFLKIPFLKKNGGHKLATIRAITREIFLCDMESWYKNLSKIRSVTFIFDNLKYFFQKRKIIEKIQIYSEKSINSFEMKKRIGHLIIYETIFFAIC